MAKRVPVKGIGRLRRGVYGPRPNHYDYDDQRRVRPWLTQLRLVKPIEFSPTPLYLPASREREAASEPLPPDLEPGRKQNLEHAGTLHTFATKAGHSRYDSHNARRIGFQGKAIDDEHSR